MYLFVVIVTVAKLDEILLLLLLYSCKPVMLVLGLVSRVLVNITSLLVTGSALFDEDSP